MTTQGDTFTVRRIPDGGSAGESFVAFDYDNVFEGEVSPAAGARLELPRAGWLRLNEPDVLLIALMTQAE